jgi:hypothetical protein
MIKTLIAFIGFAIGFAIVIQLYRDMTDKEKWDAVKTIGYSLMCAGASVMFLTALVVFF